MQAREQMSEMQLSVNESILGASMTLMRLIKDLIRHSAVLQKEIGGSSATECALRDWRSRVVCFIWHHPLRRALTLCVCVCVCACVRACLLAMFEVMLSLGCEAGGLR